VPRCDEAEAHLVEAPRDRHHPGLSLSFTVMKTAPRAAASCPASCALAKAVPNVVAIPITSPVERISGPSIGSNSRNLVNGNTASFTAHERRTISSV
jgi:hypothetical protein